MLALVQNIVDWYKTIIAIFYFCCVPRVNTQLVSGITNLRFCIRVCCFIPGFGYKFI